MSVSRSKASGTRPAHGTGFVGSALVRFARQSRFKRQSRFTRFGLALAFPILICLVADTALFAADPTPAEMEAGFSRLDQDGNGSLSKQEFNLMRERIRAELKAHFIGLARFDRMGDSGMSRLFEKMDHNRDGKLTVEEFKTLKSSLTELLKSRV